MQQNFTFIIVDDNIIDILIYKLVLKNIFPNAPIIYFTETKDGLDFIKDNYPKKSKGETILFLDLNMPVINGWEFLKEFERFDENTKRQIQIHIISFYANSENKKSADDDRNVESMITKPISKEKILTIINKHKVLHQK
ncbi:MAG: response regulator [Bacteroidia bacterium]